MIGRALAVIGGLTGAAGLSQYPEFAQQYTQRLAGHLSALETVVGDFDATAERAGMDRDAALAEMTGTTFLAERGRDMRRTINRFEGLRSDYVLLTQATPFERMLMPHRLGDAETFRGTLDDYEPAVPLTTAGAVSAAVGFFGGWAAIAAVLWLLAAPFRARRARKFATADVTGFEEVVATRPTPDKRTAAQKAPRD